MAVQICDDQALGQPGSLGSLDRLGNGAIQISQGLVDFRAHRKRVAQADDVAHA